MLESGKVGPALLRNLAPKTNSASPSKLNCLSKVGFFLLELAKSNLYCSSYLYICHILTVSNFLRVLA